MKELLQGLLARIDRGFDAEGDPALIERAKEVSSRPEGEAVAPYRECMGCAETKICYGGPSCINKTPSAAEVEADALTRLQETAPARIYLQVSDEIADNESPFPEGPSADVSWCSESVLNCEVEYVRADLAPRAAAEGVPDAELDHDGEGFFINAGNVCYGCSKADGGEA